MGRQDYFSGLTRDLISHGDFLREFNDIGFFHIVRNSEHYEIMRGEYDLYGHVPQGWVTNGHYPGIWTTFKDPLNSECKALRLFFNEGYTVFDPQSSNIEWVKWNLKGGFLKRNPWKHVRNSKGRGFNESLRKRKFPSNKSFYLENKIGAVIGVDDYVSPVILNEESISHVEFLS